MLQIKTYTAAAVLLACTSQAYAASISVEGQLSSVVGTSVAAIAVDPAAPGLTGTFDPANGDFDFAVDSYTLEITVYGGILGGDIALTDPTVTGSAGEYTSDDSGATCTDTSTGDDTNAICGGFANPPGENASSTYTWSWDAGTLTGQVIATNASGDAQAGDQIFTYDIQAPAEVPLPAAAWLFGSGLLGLAGVARRKRVQAS